MGRYIMELILYHVFKARFADMYTGPMMYFDRRVSAFVLFGEWSILTRPSDNENPSQNIDEMCLCPAKVAKPRHPHGVKI